MKAYPCEFDESVVVFEAEHGDEGIAIDMFESRGHGYCIWGEGVDPVIVVDGRIRETHGYTEDHIMAIIAHEMGHIKLETENENAADHWGRVTLLKRGNVAAADLLLRHIEA
jgi:hypothetical protein